MARAAKTTKSAKAPKPVVAARKPGRPPAAGAKANAMVNKPTPAPKRAVAIAPAVPKPSKDELRSQVEKLEGTVATLRTKNREANRAAKIATAKIAELEAQVAQLERKVALQAAPAKRAPKPAPTPAPASRGRRKGRDIDPGDAVPPGVAVQEPAPRDEEAEAALENLEEHLGGE